MMMMIQWISSLKVCSVHFYLRSRGKQLEHQDSRENKTDWFPGEPDIKFFVIFLDFLFNSDKRITGANQKQSTRLL